MNITAIVKSQLLLMLATGLAMAGAISSPVAAQGDLDWERLIRIRLGEKIAETGDDGAVPMAAAPGTLVALPESSVEPRTASAAPSLQHPIVYTRVRRTRGTHVLTLRDGERFHLYSPDIWDRLPDSRKVFEGFNAPGQLVLRYPDGRERILYNCFGKPAPCVPLDPAVSLDGSQVLFAVYRGKRLLGPVWSKARLPNEHLDGATEAQLFVADLRSGTVKALAHREGVFDVSPAWLPDGRILFASTRSRMSQPELNKISPSGRPVTQLFIANPDGTGAINVAPHEITTAMHPYVLNSGRVAYSSQWLSHNLAYAGTNGGINWPTTLDNMWMVTDMDLRGGDMTALLGAHRNSFKAADGRTKNMKALHFLGQRDNGDICVSNYYRANNLGLGDVYCWTPEPVGVEGPLPDFLPSNLYSVAHWSKSNDEPSRRQNGRYLGKIGYPEAMSGNQLLLTVGRGFCTQVPGSVSRFLREESTEPGTRACDAGVYHTTRIPSTTMSDLVRVVDLPAWHEFGARLVRQRTVRQPPLSDTADGTCQIISTDAGTAETSPQRPYKFNDNYKTSANNGGEIDGLPHSELSAIRFWQVLFNRPDRRPFKNSIGNRLRLIGDVPLLPDKSFRAQLPCNVPFLMAGVDDRGRIIKRDQVPQSLRPGEKRICTGCHLHSREGRPYRDSMAFDAPPVKLMKSRVTPFFERDIKPILQRRCQGCHGNDSPLMAYDTLVWDYFQQSLPPADRVQVSNSANERRRYGLQRPYTSKYVNSMFARESLLYWKAANKRTDGRTDNTYRDDIDFGPPHPVRITDQELKTLAEWLDSGATSIPRQ